MRRIAAPAPSSRNKPCAINPTTRPTDRKLGVKWRYVNFKVRDPRGGHHVANFGPIRGSQPGAQAGRHARKGHKDLEHAFAGTLATDAYSSKWHFMALHGAVRARLHLRTPIQEQFTTIHAMGRYTRAFGTEKHGSALTTQVPFTRQNRHRPHRTPPANECDCAPPTGHYFALSESIKNKARRKAFGFRLFSPTDRSRPKRPCADYLFYPNLHHLLDSANAHTPFFSGFNCNFLPGSDLNLAPIFLGVVQRTFTPTIVAGVCDLGVDNIDNFSRGL